MLCRSLSLLLAVGLAAAVQAQDTWQRTYGGWGTDEGRCIRETSDQGFIVVGSTGSFGAGASDVYVLKLSPSGERDWSVALGGPGIEQGWAVREAPDGGYWVAGFTDEGGNGYDGLLVRLDEGGAVLWQQRYGGADWDFLYDLELVDDGAVLAGTTTRDGAQQGWLVRVDAEGEVLWERIFGGVADEGRCVRSTTGGGFVVAGTKTLSDTASGAWMVRFDEDGNDLWEAVLGQYTVSAGYGVVETGDGGFVVAGYSVEPPERRVMMVAKTDADGTPLWVNHVDGGSGEWQGRSIRELDDGSLILAGNTSSYGAGGFDCYMAILDEWGYWVSGPSFGSAGDEDCWGLDLTSDGGFVLVGTSRGMGPGLSSVYVVKNAGGIIDDPLIEDFDPLVIHVQERGHGVLLAPNPVMSGSAVTLTWPDGHASAWVADLFGMDGRLLKQVQGLAGERRMPIDGLAAGSYLVRLAWGPDRVAAVRLVVHAE